MIKRTIYSQLSLKVYEKKQHERVIEGFSVLSLQPKDFLNVFVNSENVVLCRMKTYGDLEEKQSRCFFLLSNDVVFNERQCFDQLISTEI